VTTDASLDGLLADLDAEFRALRSVVGRLGDTDPTWDLPTPADGWAVRDQISHLAYFDEAGRLAVVDPEGFAVEVERLVGSDGDPMDVHLTRGRSIGGDELLAWWDGAHAGMMAAFAHVEPSARVPWFGPAMGARSFVTARVMETWAHGQDVLDALGLDRQPTDRLRHIAHLGVRARTYSYMVRGLEVPHGRIDVVLAAPSDPEGIPWEWRIGESADTPGSGDPTPSSDDGADDLITGSALDFCLVTTQRRHLADTDLVVRGPLAAGWMAIAQAFAGPAGTGRTPLADS
jgi:uncharacterized protein (TIGR03084 family)